MLVHWTFRALSLQIILQKRLNSISLIDIFVITLRLYEFGCEINFNRELKPRPEIMGASWLRHTCFSVRLSVFPHAKTPNRTLEVTIKMFTGIRIFSIETDRNNGSLHKNPGNFLHLIC